MRFGAALLNGLYRLRQASAAITIGQGSRVYRWRLNLGAAGNRLVIGTHSIVQCRISFDAHSGRVRIGDRTYIGSSHIVCHSDVSIGSDVIISWGVTIVDHDSHALHWQQRSMDVAEWRLGRKSWQHVPQAPVHVADKVWIGFGASVLKGVSIGEGAVVGACSVVTRDVPPYAVVAGNPARIVRNLDPSGLAPQ